jgi:ubiquinone/menaquinone biosynthesis C-methylase UbiE
MYVYNPWGRHFGHPKDAWKKKLISEELKQAKTVAGVDIDDEALALARKKIMVVKADLQKGLPFRDNTFDSGIGSEVLEHLVELQTALFEMNRVLKNGGFYIITTPNVGFLGKRLRLLLGEFELHPPSSKFFPHVRFFTLKSLGFVLKDFGFEITRVYTRRTWQKLRPSLLCSELMVKAVKVRSL